MSTGEVNFLCLRPPNKSANARGIRKDNNDTVRIYATSPLSRGSLLPWRHRRLAPSGLMGPQEAVIHTVRVDDGSRDVVHQIVGGGKGALYLIGDCACARGVERRDGAVGTTQKPVVHVVRVKVVTGNVPKIVDVGRLCIKTYSWNVKRCDCSVG